MDLEIENCQRGVLMPKVKKLNCSQLMRGKNIEASWRLMPPTNSKSNNVGIVLNLPRALKIPPKALWWVIHRIGHLKNCGPHRLSEGQRFWSHRRKGREKTASTNHFQHDSQPAKVWFTLTAVAFDTLLFTLYTHDLTSKHHSVQLLMFADDMTVTDPIQDGDESVSR